MNYNTLKELLTLKRINVPALAKEIGMSKPGLYLAIEKERLTIKALEKIAEALEVPVSAFFDENKLVEDSALIELKKENEALKTRIFEITDQLDDKRKIIKFTNNTLEEILRQWLSLSNSTNTDKDFDMWRNKDFHKLSSLIVFGISSIVFRDNKDEQFIKLTKMAESGLKSALDRNLENDSKNEKH